MALSKFFRFPFGTSGDRAAVPDPVDVNGNVSYEQGYGPDYQRANTDPLSKDIERNKANQLQYDVTLALREYQTNGTPDWITAAQNNGVPYPYPAYARVRGADGITYTSTINANTNTPPHASWVADAIATPPQFDNDLSAATTAFVQRALGNYQAAYPIASAVVLTAADVGKNVTLNAGGSATLPLGSSVTNGASILFGSTAAARTVACQGSDTMNMLSGTVSSVALDVGDTLLLVFNGSQWVAFGGSTQLQYSNKFGASLGTSGYQRLPSGLIVQWGSATSNGAGVATFVHPIAFPLNWFNAWVTYAVGSFTPTRTINVGGAAVGQTNAYVNDSAGNAVSNAGINFLVFGR